MATRSANVEVMVRAVLKAGRLMVRDFGEIEQLQGSVKGPGDFGNAAERRAAETIIGELVKARPEFSLTGQGGTRAGTFPEHRWLVEPLAGSLNFVHGHPHWAISIALEQHGEITAAVVYDPLRNELFTSDKGNGVYLNDRRLRVSRRPELDDALVGYVTRPDHRGARAKASAAQLLRLTDGVAGLRCSGTAALDMAYVAAGRLDGFWQTGDAPWSVAAGVLLVRESGGRVGRLEGDETLLDAGTLVAGNAGVYEKLRAVLLEATPLAA